MPVVPSRSHSAHNASKSGHSPSSVASSGSGTSSFDRAVEAARTSPDAAAVPSAASTGATSATGSSNRGGNWATTARAADASYQASMPPSGVWTTAGLRGSRPSRASSTVAATVACTHISISWRGTK